MPEEDEVSVRRSALDGGGAANLCAAKRVCWVRVKGPGRSTNSCEATPRCAPAQNERKKGEKK